MFVWGKPTDVRNMKKCFENILGKQMTDNFTSGKKYFIQIVVMKSQEDGCRHGSMIFVLHILKQFEVAKCRHVLEMNLYDAEVV